MTTIPGTFPLGKRLQCSTEKFAMGTTTTTTTTIIIIMIIIILIIIMIIIIIMKHLLSANL